MVGKSNASWYVLALFDISTKKLCTISNILLWNQNAFSWNLEVLTGTDSDVTVWNWVVIHDQWKLLQELLSMVSPDQFRSDKVIWRLNDDGEFSVNSVEDLVSKSKSLAWPTLTVNLLAAVWKMMCSLKIKIFAWRMMINILPLKDLLILRGVTTLENNLNCVFCNSSQENSNHLFFQCSVSIKVWERIFLWLHYAIKGL